MPVPLTVFVAACLLSIATSISAVVLVLREPALSWKPLWVILAAIGVGGAAMVWSTPGTVHWFFGVAVPTASYVAAEDSLRPALLRCLFPAGALMVFVRIYLHRRNRGIRPERCSATR